MKMKELFENFDYSKILKISREPIGKWPAQCKSAYQFTNYLENEKGFRYYKMAIQVGRGGRDIWHYAFVLAKELPDKTWQIADVSSHMTDKVTHGITQIISRYSLDLSLINCATKGCQRAKG